MRRLFWSLTLFVFAFGWGAAAQSDVLTAENVTLDTTLDVFGVESQIATGTIINTSETDAYADVSVFAELYDDANELIGEGVGILVNQCDKNIPLNYTLAPGGEQRFLVSLELYEQDTEIDRVTVFASGRAVEADESSIREPISGIIPVANREVARLEWWTVDHDDDDETPEEVRLYYGVGCYRDVFTAYDWYAYNPNDDTTRSAEHPRADVALDEDFQAAMDMQSQFTNDDFSYLFNRSGLTFEPNGVERALFQTDINTLVTTQFDGRFRRIVDDELFRSTLQGVNWINNGRFVAYYYGAYGDGVTYLVASVDAAYFSTPERLVTPSMTVPTVTPNIGGVIVSGAFQDDVPGFYIKPPASNFYDLWFEWENLPGNNYPAPVYRSRGGIQQEDVVYFALPDENDRPRLHCYDRRAAERYELAPLPFELGTEDRAYMMLSPDGTQIALGANGVNGGVWLLNLNEFDQCAPQDDTPD